MSGAAPKQNRDLDGGAYVNWTWPRLMEMTVQVWPVREAVKHG